MNDSKEIKIKREDRSIMQNRNNCGVTGGEWFAVFTGAVNSIPGMSYIAI